MHGKSFPYQTLPKPSKATLKTIALPDRGSVQLVNPIVGGAAPRRRVRAARGSATGPRPAPRHLIAAACRSRARCPTRSWSARRTARAVIRSMVAGPQVAYFSPEILMEEDIHGPGVDAEGAAFPGVNLYVELGQGATTRGRPPPPARTSSTRSRCRSAIPAAARSHLQLGLLPAQRADACRWRRSPASSSWTPNAGRPTPPGSVTFQTLRTAYGLVIARARIPGGRSSTRNLRSTYMHELDSALGFSLLNDPDDDPRPAGLLRMPPTTSSTRSTGSTPTPQHIAYFDSGLNPVRRRTPIRCSRRWASDPWQGFRPRRADDPREPHREADRPERASARDRPVVPDQVEQQAGARIQRRRHRPAVLLDLPLAAAGQQHQPLPRRSTTASCRSSTSSTRWAMQAPRTCAASRCCHTR